MAAPKMNREDLSASAPEDRQYLYAVRGVDKTDPRSTDSLKNLLIETQYSVDYDGQKRAYYGTAPLPEQLGFYTGLEAERTQASKRENEALEQAARAQAEAGPDRAATQAEFDKAAVPVENRVYVSVVKDPNSPYDIDGFRAVLDEMEAGRLMREKVEGAMTKHYVDGRIPAAAEAAREYQTPEAEQAMLSFQEKLSERRVETTSTTREAAQTKAAGEASDVPRIFPSSVADPLRKPKEYAIDMKAIRGLVMNLPEKAGDVIRITAKALHNAEEQLSLVMGRPRDADESAKLARLNGKKDGWERGVKVLMGEYSRVHGVDALDEELKKGITTLKYLPKEVQEEVRKLRAAEREERMQASQNKTK